MHSAHTRLSSLRRVALAAAVSVAVLPAMAAVAAAQDGPTAGEVEAARRCAIDTRLAGHAFAQVRDSVRAGSTDRAEAQLSVAEGALMEARSSCRGNYDVSIDLDRLAGDVEGLRRALLSTR